MNLKFLRFAAPICLGLSLLTVGSVRADAGEGLSYTSVIKAVPMEVKRAVESPVKEPNNWGTGISEEQAIKIVRAAFPDLDWESKPEVSLDPSGPDQMCWSISLYNRSGYGSPRNRGFHARVDAGTGEILDFNGREIQEAGGSEIIPREKARVIAEDFIHKMQPEKISCLRLDEGPDPMVYYSPERTLDIAYQFNWSRMANGLKIDNDGIRVAVNALSGRVTSYSYNWQKDLRLPRDTKDPVPAKDISDRLIRDTGLLLSYHVPYGSYTGAIPKARLVYRVNSSYRIVDALTGEFMDYQGQLIEPGDLKQFGQIPQISGDMNPPSPGAKRISPSTAQEKAEKFFQALGYQGKVERRGSGSGSGPLGREEFWSYTLENNESGDLRVGIEVFSGRVANFHRRDLYPGQTVITGQKNLSRDEALKKAHDFIVKIEPEISRFLVAQNLGRWIKEAATTAYGFHFSRVANGIPFPQDGIHITVGRDGGIIDYTCDWHRVEFPPAEAKISSADAAAIWLESSPFKLAYFFPRDEKGRAGEARLAYMTQYNGVETIDAVTGEAFRGDGRTLNKGQDYNDFSGSWASPQLQILAENKLLPPPEKFSASSPVSRRESVRILLAAAAQHYYSDDRRPDPFFQDVKETDPDFTTIQMAVETGLLDKGGSFLPGENLTRKTLAEWLVKGLGYKEAAAIPNKIKAPFNDISTLTRKEQNYIALANGLGLLAGEGHSFRPDAAVTWEELSAAVMKAAPRLRNRLNQ